MAGLLSRLDVGILSVLDLAKGQKINNLCLQSIMFLLRKADLPEVDFKFVFDFSYIRSDDLTWRLKELIKFGFINKEIIDHRNFYSISEKGIEALFGYNLDSRFVEIVDRLLLER